jgi:hypothetical protein
MWFITFIDFHMLNLHPWDEAYLVVVIDLFDALLNSVCHYFIEGFCITVH